MIPKILVFTIKDWIIAIVSIILIICILKIRKLKKSITQEVRQQLIPQLALELISAIHGIEDAGLYLKNESFFLAQDIRLEDSVLGLEEFGVKIDYILQFENIDFLRPQERVKLKFKVLDNNRDYLPDVTEKIIPHLVNSSLQVKILYSNIENIKFCTILLKKREKFYAERIEPCQ